MRSLRLAPRLELAVILVCILIAGWPTDPTLAVSRGDTPDAVPSTNGPTDPETV